MKQTSTPKAPSHLSDKAKTLWKRINRDFELEADAVETLRVALENLDLADAARALLVEAGEGTKIELLAEDEKTVLTWGHGVLFEGLPPGRYFVRIAGQSAAIDVAAGVVTGF